MYFTKIAEYGYEEAVLGFSLSYNTDIDRAKDILPRYAFGVAGENKFLESMFIVLDVVAPRYWWQEADTYRISTKQSESTMHTLMKRPLRKSDFEDEILPATLAYLNQLIEWYKNPSLDKGKKKEVFKLMKSNLPEGFLQRRIWTMSYKTLRNILEQRSKHRLDIWKNFCEEVYHMSDYKEFLKDTN